jgi:hypothetical protein
MIYVRFGTLDSQRLSYRTTYLVRPFFFAKCGAALHDEMQECVYPFSKMDSDQLYRSETSQDVRNFPEFDEEISRLTKYLLCYLEEFLSQPPGNAPGPDAASPERTIDGECHSSASPNPDPQLSKSPH